MTRFRGAAALLAAVVLTALFGAGVATAAPPRLSPTPPVPLPAHVGPSPHHGGSPHHRAGPQQPKPKPLPNTGLPLVPMLLAATALLALGSATRLLADPRRY